MLHITLQNSYASYIKRAEVLTVIKRAARHIGMQVPGPLHII